MIVPPAGPIEVWFQRFIWLPKDAYYALLALWVIHTHAIDYAHTTPYLCITSPVPRCGKSILLEVLGSVTRPPVAASDLTPASMFRMIDGTQAPLLVDEVDAQLSENRERRAAMQTVFNGGYRRGTQATVIRCEPRSLEPRRFDIFGPKAVAGIRIESLLLPSTLDRAVQLVMQRKPRGAQVERFRSQAVDAHAAGLRSDIEAWVTAHSDELASAIPALPTALHDRAQESWEPLLAIADILGGDWPERARHAAVELSGTPDEDDEDIAIILLSDLREIFAGQADSQAPVFSADICKELERKDDRPWRHWATRRRNHAFSPTDLAKLLKPFGIKPSTVRRGSKTLKGYWREQFQDAWALYVEEPETADEHCA